MCSCCLFVLFVVLFTWVDICLPLTVCLPSSPWYIQLAEKHKTMLDEVVLTSQEAADEHMTRVEEIDPVGVQT